jgi:hypothetical protein
MVGENLKLNINVCMGTDQEPAEITFWEIFLSPISTLFNKNIANTLKK